MQPAVRLLLLLARIGDKATANLSECCQLTSPHSGGGSPLLSTAVAVIDAALVVLLLSPPGVCVSVFVVSLRECVHVYMCVFCAETAAVRACVCDLAITVQ
jgi:hypothetical protein